MNVFDMEEIPLLGVLPHLVLLPHLKMPISQELFRQFSPNCISIFYSVRTTTYPKISPKKQPPFSIHNSPSLYNHFVLPMNLQIVLRNVSDKTDIPNMSILKLLPFEALEKGRQGT
jgi:hypothetical protein